MKNHKKSQPLAILLLLGLMLFGLVVAFLISKSAVMSDRSEQSYVLAENPYFQFEYKNGWHVVTIGVDFYLNPHPIIVFPHAEPSLIHGSSIQESDYEAAVSSGNKSIDIPFSSTVEGMCLREDASDPPAGPYPESDGVATCYIKITDHKNDSNFFQISTSRANNSENFAEFKHFVTSIRAR